MNTLSYRIVRRISYDLARGICGIRVDCFRSLSKLALLLYATCLAGIPKDPYYSGLPPSAGQFQTESFLYALLGLALIFLLARIATRRGVLRNPSTSRKIWAYWIVYWSFRTLVVSGVAKSLALAVNIPYDQGVVGALLVAGFLAGLVVTLWLIFSPPKLASTSRPDSSAANNRPTASHTMADQASQHYSAQQVSTVNIPRRTFADVGGLESVKEQIRSLVLTRLDNSQ
jgi:SpoVK/Ycf46/Vps4 family AAA+-type ATPase